MIGIHLSTKDMTVAMHEVGRRRLLVTGVDGSLGIFDIWESQEAWDSFLTHLVPLLQDIGIELNAPPDVMPIVSLNI